MASQYTSLPLTHNRSVPVLEVNQLEVAIGASQILRGVSFELESAKTLGVVGESGCGKSITGMTIMGMAPGGAKISGSIKLDGVELIGMPESQMRRIRGAKIAIVMQDPFTSLNPMMRVGKQIEEVLRLHQNLSPESAQKQSVHLLEHVGVPSPQASAQKYPFQMSGGQRQRVVIAIAFACKPDILIADEPTTALDVTLQAQILRLIRDLQQEVGTAVMLISHDIGVIASVSDRICVYYAGRVIETGSAEEVLRQPSHPYTRALLGAVPSEDKSRLKTIPGQPPDLQKPILGCSFRERCTERFEKCSDDPTLFRVNEGHDAACWRVPMPTESR